MWSRSAAWANCPCCISSRAFARPRSQKFSSSAAERACLYGHQQRTRFRSVLNHQLRQHAFGFHQLALCEEDLSRSKFFAILSVRFQLLAQCLERGFRPERFQPPAENLFRLFQFAIRHALPHFGGNGFTLRAAQTGIRLAL